MASGRDAQLQRNLKKPVKVNGFEDAPRPFLIGVGGGTASGKSTVCKKIMEQLGELEIDEKQRHVIILSIESFYRPLTDEEQVLAKKGQINFDHPSTFDEGLMLDTLKAIKRQETVKVPKYDFVKNCRKEDEYVTVYPADVILFEGILVFYFKEIRDLFHMKLFVDTDADTRLSRRVVRDLKEMGRELDFVLHQYTSFVKPAFEEFCLPTKKYADVIIPRGADNTVAIELIVQQIRELMKPSRNGAVRRVRHNSDSLLVFNYDPSSSIVYRSAH